ncbi:MAG: hypothetical protein NC200_03775 [Candidatus Gastranaerophilales bacterium]|nr:hypothetical protein [Candidatus Gastranaerophilales bacterium]
MEKLVEHLKDIGLNTYEAKVYLALLKKYPATGYEVSKLANIPQSRTYDTLKALTQKLIVTATADKPVEYTPIKPTELTKRVKRKFNLNLDYLEKHLPDVKDNYIEPVLSVNGEDNIQSKLVEIIRSAKKEIYLEIWSQDFKSIEKELLNAYNRNIEIRIVGYDRLKSSFGLVYEHPFSKKLENYFNGRVVILAVDDNEGLFGRIYSNVDEPISATWTQNKDIVFLIKELIVHDMFILDIQNNLPEELMYRYGNGLKRLYDKVLGVNNIFRN